MSEASDSLQIRTDDVEGCIAKLREAGINGFVFRGHRGWLTVVPYADPARHLPFLSHWAEHLAVRLRLPIIAYSCHEDFGWSFLLAMPDGRSTEFVCMADPSGEWAPSDDAPSPFSTRRCWPRWQRLTPSGLSSNRLRPSHGKEGLPTASRRR